MSAVREVSKSKTRGEGMERLEIPEQSSVEKPGTETTRTTGGYFSENRHMAPLSTALAYSRMSVATGASYHKILIWTFNSNYYIK
jgi:hypothetical protein